MTGTWGELSLRWVQLAYDRQSLVIAAFVALMLAGTVVTIGAIVLWRREGRHHRRGAIPRDHSDPNER